MKKQIRQPLSGGSNAGRGFSLIERSCASMSSLVQDPTLLAKLAGHRLVPVVVIDDPGTADSLGHALVAGGLPVAEVTFRTAAGLESLRRLAGRGDLLVGAGTVFTPAQVDQAVAAGAAFIVSPGLSRAVVERCV